MGIGVDIGNRFICDRYSSTLLSTADPDADSDSDPDESFKNGTINDV